MKTFIALLLFLSFISISASNSFGIVKSTSSSMIRHEVLILDSDSTFSAINETPVNIGYITLTLNYSSSVNLSVTGSGTFSTNISQAPVLCTINGHSFGYNTPTWITIDAHTSIRVTWYSPLVILIDDWEEF